MVMTDADVHARFPAPAHHSLEAAPRESRIRKLYPEDYFPGGAYVNLPHGRVRYWILGPENGRKVVLIHGLTIPAITWKYVAPTLAENGFRVLLLDLYGKGYSEAPRTTYDPNLFITQVAMLLQFVDWKKAAIVGFSMGGGITSAFAASLPHLVDGKLVFIASAGIPNSPADVVRKRSGPPIPIPSMSEIRELQAEALPGYKDAIASIIQHGPLYGLSVAFEIIGISDIEVLIIHGTEDDIVIHDSAVPGIKGKIPQARVVSIEGAEHDLLVVSPYQEMVTKELITFLK